MSVADTYDLLDVGELNKPSSPGYSNYFFIGVGGIGMSALARYFKAKGKNVIGYDRTNTALTKTLEQEGIRIHFEDNIDLIPEDFSAANTQVVYTPAIPKGHKQFNYFTEHKYNIKKRSEILGDITQDYMTIAVAGTHGKTTTSSMIAHFFNFANEPCTAFLGGISTNLNSNFLLSDNEMEQIVVVEADEFDRSFLRIHPDIAVITSVEADHLDIYGQSEKLEDSFREFASRLDQDGTLIVQEKFAHLFKTDFTYGREQGDYYVSNVRIKDGRQWFDACTPEGTISELPMHQPGLHNIENALAAIAVAQQFGIPGKTIRKALDAYRGVKRRFEYIINNENLVFIDDYAHHPTEIKMLISSVRELYPNRKITVVFQPHLYSRTRDFADGFSESLSLADLVVLCPIYPAREEPIEGVSAEMLLEKITCEKQVISKEELKNKIPAMEPEVLLTVGAGDIDKEVLPIKEALLDRIDK